MNKLLMFGAMLGLAFGVAKFMKKHKQQETPMQEAAA